MKRPLLGVHASVAGGFPRALERGEALGCDTIQIFVKNANRWQAKPIEPAAAAAFREAHRESPIGPLFAHASYLINLAAVDEKTLSRSRAALADELERCAALGVDGLVLHPGAHLGEGVEAGVAAVAASLDIVFGPLLDRLPDLSVRLLLENTAGQGTVLGHRLEELAAIIEAADCKQHLGVCLDSCHAFAAGYPVHEEGGWGGFYDQVEATVGLDRLACFHINDSKQPFDSRRDRHENLGEGEMGEATFHRLVQEPRTAGLPLLLETPKGDEKEQDGYARDLAVLRAGIVNSPSGRPAG